MTPEDVARIFDVPVEWLGTCARPPTAVLNPRDAAALQAIVGPLPDGAVTVSYPVDRPDLS